MSLCEGVLKIIQEQAVVQDYSKVTRVTLEVGVLSAVLPEALEMCFGAVTRGTLAEDARLDIVMVPGEAECRECGAHVEIKDRISPCPECGKFGLRVKAGDMLRIKEMEVD